MDTIHVSNLKKCLGNANLHLPLNEIKIDKTLHFVKEPVEIMDHEIKSLKRSRILLVKFVGIKRVVRSSLREREKRLYEVLTCVDIVWKLLVLQVSIHDDKKDVE
ncbi:hypothetical protein Tco_0546821 [Tanacetum coccineum]